MAFSCPLRVGGMCDGAGVRGASSFTQQVVRALAGVAARPAGRRLAES